MKILLATIKGLYNYGAVLQGYATYEYLRKLNHDVELIDYYPYYFESEVPIYKKMIIQLITLIKRNKINKFVKSNMKLTSKTYRSFDEIKNDHLKADAFIVGSDQVWNSELSEGKLDPTYFLDFTESNNKIAFSSSIGRVDVDNNELKEMKEYLKGFSDISVREESAKKLLEEAGVPQVTNVLDPVFLLEKEEYKKFVKPVKYDKYLLLYSFEKNEVTQKIANSIAKKLGLEVIEIGLLRPYYKSDKYIHNAGVEDFLSLMYNADFVVTSSFHGTAFSILLNKQFISVAPSVRKTRLENIMNLFGISNRLITEQSKYEIDKLIKPIDYTIINELVKKESDKGKRFLEEALDKVNS